MYSSDVASPLEGSLTSPASFSSSYSNSHSGYLSSSSRPTRPYPPPHLSASQPFPHWQIDLSSLHGIAQSITTTHSRVTYDPHTGRRMSMDKSRSTVLLAAARANSIPSPLSQHDSRPPPSHFAMVGMSHQVSEHKTFHDEPSGQGAGRWRPPAQHHDDLQQFEEWQQPHVASTLESLPSHRHSLHDAGPLYPPPVAAPSQSLATYHLLTSGFSPGAPTQLEQAAQSDPQSATVPYATQIHDHDPFCCCTSCVATWPCMERTLGIPPAPVDYNHPQPEVAPKIYDGTRFDNFAQSPLNVSFHSGSVLGLDLGAAASQTRTLSPLNLSPIVPRPPSHPPAESILDTIPESPSESFGNPPTPVSSYCIPEYTGNGLPTHRPFAFAVAPTAPHPTPAPTQDLHLSNLTASDSGLADNSRVMFAPVAPAFGPPCMGEETSEQAAVPFTAHQPSWIGVTPAQPAGALRAFGYHRSQDEHV